MKLIVAKNYEELSKKAADIIAAQVIIKPNAILGLATGSSPIGTYKELVRRYNEGELDFSSVTSINLDEYKGLDRENDQSYYYFMWNNLFKYINIDKNKINLPDGTKEEDECDRYNNLIEELGGADIQLLGLGHNGHIGFNEPCSEFIPKVHQVALTDTTIEANKRFFESIDDVPKFAYTMGIKNIMDAKKILVVVSGADKKEILHKVLEGSVTPEVPASILQLHKDVTIICDESAY